LPVVANVISVDVEEWFQVEAFSHLIPRSSWDGLERRARHSVELLLELFERKGVHATFFALGWIAERDPELLKMIAGLGHEIASHGWSHQTLWNLSPEALTEEASRSKNLLEAITGQEVLGFRAPTFSITKDNLWALSTLAECGYKYDSSIFPVIHDRYGIPDSPLEFHRRQEGIIEMPMSVLSLGKYRLPVAGGGYFRIFPLGLTIHAITKMNTLGRPAVVYLHPWEFDPDQPRWPGVKPLTKFRHHYGICNNLSKLDSLLDRFSFCTARASLQKKGLLN
jgi:polysaccharide deacetylase family protein (PEP-CTERM system associated)